jgi:uncharacterized protein
VIEADGSVYPCDFYCLDPWRLGNIRDATLREMFNTDTMRRFLSPAGPAPLCRDCPYRRLCGGGCKRMRGVVYAAEGGDFCGYRAFLKAHGAELAEVARKLSR